MAVPITVASQVKDRAEELSKKREKYSKELETAGSGGLATLKADLKQILPGANTDNIIGRITKLELSYDDIREALLKGGIKGVRDYLAPSVTSGPRRSARHTGGTRKNTTSSFRRTQRLLR